MTGTDGNNLTQTDRMVRPDEICWRLEPAVRVEDRDVADLLSLNPAEVLAYAADVREDMRAVRETLHQAITIIATQSDQLARAARITDRLREEYRALRVQILERAA